MAGAHPDRLAQGRPFGLFCGLTVLDVIQLVDEPPGPDEKVTALDQVVAAGGPATNAAVTFAALGGRAVLAAPVGEGLAAALVRADLEAHGVELVDCAAAAGPAAAGPPGTGRAAFPAGAQAVSPVLPGSRGPGGTRGSGPPSTSSCWQGSLSVSSCIVSARTAQRSVVSTNARLPVDPAPLRRLARGVEQGREPVPDVVLVDGHNPVLARTALDIAEAAYVTGSGGAWRAGGASSDEICENGVGAGGGTGTGGGAGAGGAGSAAGAGHAPARTGGGPLRLMDAGSWKDDAADLLTRCDVVAASARFHPPGAAAAGSAAPGPDDVAAWLLGRGVPAVVVTQGGQEALWWCADGVAGAGTGAGGAEERARGARGGVRRGSVRPPEVRAVDTLGAGDAFHGALALALATLPAGAGATAGSGAGTAGGAAAAVSVPARDATRAVRLTPSVVSEAVRWSCEVAAASTTSVGTRAWLGRLPAGAP